MQYLRYWKQSIFTNLLISSFHIYETPLRINCIIRLTSLSWVFSSFLVPWAPFSMLGGPCGTGCDEVHFPVQGGWDSTKQNEICKHYKQSPTNMLNDQLHYKTHTLFDTITYASLTNISSIPITINWKRTSSKPIQPGPAKHWKWCT